MDLHPTYGNESNLSTSPPITTSAIYRKKPTQANQLGKSTPYISNGEHFTIAGKPHHYQLAAWDNARRKEPIIIDGLQKIQLAIRTKLGSYEHPNKEIEDFVNANIDNLLSTWIGNAITTALWAGFSVSEPIWTYKMGPSNIPQVWLEDIVGYNPISINFRLNKQHRLTHGEKLPDSIYHTGIWVPAPEIYGTKPKKHGPSYMGSHIRLPRGKFFYTAIGNDTSVWGTSLVGGVLEYHLFKEAFRDMLAIALDRYGTPLVYAVVPNQQTNELITELDGSTRPKWLHEQVKEALSDLRGEIGLVFTQLDKDHPVKLDALTTSNNFADAFNEAIKMCDSNMMIGLGIPNLIIRDENYGLGTSGAAEMQTELFHAYISAIYRRVINDFLNQVVLQLIQYNFDPRIFKDAHKPGKINERPMRWSELKIITDAIGVLTKLGYIYPEELSDVNHVRETLFFPPIDKLPIINNTSNNDSNNDSNNNSDNNKNQSNGEDT